MAHLEAPALNRSMRLYNTLTRGEEPFAPSADNTVRMYTCGLTVYARGHIGNFRTFVCLDVLRRTLKYLCGYRVRQVMNFTDVDDKTISASQKTHLSLRDYTNRYVKAFEEDAAAMGLEPIDHGLGVARGSAGKFDVLARQLGREGAIRRDERQRQLDGLRHAG